jgi:chromosome partitioning protein
MFVITFANPKGGSGKTTSAMLLAEQIQAAGAAVTILDCDPNQNIVAWGAARAKQGLAIPFHIVPVPDEDSILDTIDAMRASADYLIVDLEGTASQTVTYAVSQSDLVLVPFEPTPMEARQAARAVQLVRNTARMANRTIPHALLLTRVNAAFQTSEEKDVRKDTQSHDIPVLKTAIVRRAAYTRIFREGMLVSELRALAAEQLKGASASAQDRILKPFDSALKNAQDFAQEVLDGLVQKAAAA